MYACILCVLIPPTARMSSWPCSSEQHLFVSSFPQGFVSVAGIPRAVFVHSALGGLCRSHSAAPVGSAPLCPPPFADALQTPPSSAPCCHSVAFPPGSALLLHQSPPNPPLKLELSGRCPLFSAGWMGHFGVGSSGVPLARPGDPRYPSPGLSRAPLRFVAAAPSRHRAHPAGFSFSSSLLFPPSLFFLFTLLFFLFFFTFLLFPYLFPFPPHKSPFSLFFFCHCIARKAV